MPLYLSAGIETAAIRAEWIGGMAPHLIFGVPATLILFVTLGVVMRRTEALDQEMDRRAKAEDALRQSQKMDAIGQLTGGVAHDFNNLLPSSSAISRTQRQLELATEAGQAKLVRRIENAMLGAQRAATLTKRLLAFSRQQPLNPKALDVNRLLNGLVDFRAAASARTSRWRS